jgi:hypothetical protein
MAGIWTLQTMGYSPVSHFNITLGELKSFTRRADSEKIFTNSFCPDCGAHIHHRASKVPGHISLKSGALDDTGWLTHLYHVCFRSAQLWMTFPEHAQVFDTLPSDLKWLTGE